MSKTFYRAKQNHILKMSSKLDCPDTASKTCWSIISRFLNKEDVLLVNRKLVSDFDKKLNYLINTLWNNVP